MYAGAAIVFFVFALSYALLFFVLAAFLLLFFLLGEALLLRISLVLMHVLPRHCQG